MSHERLFLIIQLIVRLVLSNPLLEQNSTIDSRGVDDLLKFPVDFDIFSPFKVKWPLARTPFGQYSGGKIAKWI